MHPTNSTREKVFLFMKILWPILVTQIGLYSMNVIDTVMTGRVGAEDLAGVAIGTNVWMPVFTGLSGILIAVTPIVSHFVGGGQHKQIKEVVTQAIYLSVLLTIIVLLLGLVFLDNILYLMDIIPEVQHIAKHYLIGLSFGILPLFIGSVFRNFYDALGFTRITMGIILLAIPVNVLFNYILIFGKFGYPKLGGIGAGYATAITYWFVLAFSVIIMVFYHKVSSYRILRDWPMPSFRAWIDQLKVGIPIGLSIFFEVSIFAAVTLLMSQFSTNTLAAHSAALNFTSLIFMIPLSISFALTIVVGFEVGGKRLQDAIVYTKMGVLTAIGILMICSIGLFLFRGEIAKFYSNDMEVIILIQQFLIFAIFYQFSDAAQASIQGVLRGYKDVTVPFIMALVSYWVIGLPAGYALANYTELKAFGYWIGITCGLTAAAIGFSIRLLYIQKKYRIGEAQLEI